MLCEECRVNEANFTVSVVTEEEMAMEVVVPLMSPVLPPASIQVPCIVRPVKTPALTLPWKVPVMVTFMPTALVPSVEKVATMTSPSFGMLLVEVMPEVERSSPMRPL